jgi:hypothetical protein
MTGRFGERGYSLNELLIACAAVGLVMAAVVGLSLTGSIVALSGQNKTEAQQGARGTFLMEEDLRLAGYGYPANTTTNPVFTAASATAVTFWADLSNASTTLTAAVAAGTSSLSVESGVGLASGDPVYVNGGNAGSANQGVWEHTTVSSATGTTVSVAANLVNSYPAGAQVGAAKQITYSWDGVGTVSRNGGSGALPVVTGVTAFSLSYYDATETLIPAASLSASLPTIRRVAISMTVESTAAQNRGTFTLNSSVRPRNL